MAFGGLKPVVAVYASFLNRAFDQVLLDAALHDENVTIVLDRAGITGDDGPSHNGIWDISLLGCVPNLTVFAPWNESGLTSSLSASTAEGSGVHVIRFPKGEVDETCKDFEAELLVGELDAPDVVLVPVGVMLSAAIAAYQDLNAMGIKCQVRAATQIQPVPSSLLADIPADCLVVTIEDGILQGGFGSRFRDLLPISQPVVTIGVTSGFPEAKPRKSLLEENGMTSTGIVAKVVEVLEK
jgi:1-deoxy-D-xylulose-5-phosphate synthase